MTCEGLERNFHGLGELAQEARVVVVEVADVVDAVDQHRDALEAEAEGEAGPLGRVEPAELEDLRVELDGLQQRLGIGGVEEAVEPRAAEADHEQGGRHRGQHPRGAERQADQLAPPAGVHHHRVLGV